MKQVPQQIFLFNATGFKQPYIKPNKLIIMSSTTSEIKKDLSIFSLQIKQEVPLPVFSPEGQEFAFDMMQPQQNEAEKLYAATVDILGKTDVPIAGSMLDDGEHFASVNLATTGYTFDELFSDFASDLSQFFVFDDVSVQLLQKPGESLANIINFTGKLRLDSPILAVFK